MTVGRASPPAHSLQWHLPKQRCYTTVLIWDSSASWVCAAQHPNINQKNTSCIELKTLPRPTLLFFLLPSYRETVALLSTGALQICHLALYDCSITLFKRTHQETWFSSCRGCKLGKWCWRQPMMYGACSSKSASLLCARKYLWPRRAFADFHSIATWSNWQDCDLVLHNGLIQIIPRVLTVILISCNIRNFRPILIFKRS